MAEHLFEPLFALAWLALVNHDTTGTRRTALRSACGVHNPSQKRRVKWHENLAKKSHLVPFSPTSRTPRASIFLRRLSFECLWIGPVYVLHGASKSRVRTFGAPIRSSRLGKWVSIGDHRRGQFECRLTPAQSTRAGVPFQVCTAQGKEKAELGHGPDPW